ncbi:hypothetical protein H0H81_011543 [Sphagnurus paluster]|uniref:Uncharacterized protein n=1 Tax=Sphagnurus paluster TaxID=117069 RepID=A0A9P7GJV9_9AGAR|nr:hypothetical protein H0H81_011543 [Sphagnurus paluster]
MSVLFFNCVHVVSDLTLTCRTSRGQAPPVNLKERIAALQQRNVSPGTRPISPTAPAAPHPNSAGLRDKIAKFEKKGGVPVPRGSFGLGAPPLAENAPLKRRGELYGNRIPGSVKVSGGAPPSRSTSPFDTTRSFSMSGLEGEEYDDHTPSSPTFPMPRLTPHHTGNSAPRLTPNHTGNRHMSPHSTPFATALEMARRTEGNLETTLRPVDHDIADTHPFTEPDVPPIVSDVPTSETPHVLASEPESPEIPTEPLSPPAIVLSPSVEPDQEQGLSDPTKLLLEEDSSQISIPDINSEEASMVLAVEVSAPEPTEPLSEEESNHIPVPDNTTSDEASPVAPIVKVSAPEPNITSPTPVVTVTETVTEPDTPVADTPKSDVAEPASSPASDASLSPVGPFTLSNAVHDLGKVVAHIHDMFPDQISPLADPPAFRPFRIEETPAEQQQEQPKTQVKAKKSVPDLQIAPPPSSDAKADVNVSAVQHLQLPGDDASYLSSPRSSRPVSMIETSPSHVVVAHRVTPLTSRGVPVFLEPQHYEHFPPTPEPHESEFGTISMHKPSHSFSHARTYHGHGAADKMTHSSFSAVVHGKVTEVPPVPSSSYKQFYAKAPETPQMNRTRSAATEVPQSPGYGDLATLLHEAALLELTLEQGELPDEVKPLEKPEKKADKGQDEDEERLEREREAAARARVEEEKRKHEAVAKARAKQEARDSKSSKSSFRNPLLRSKSSHRREVSADSEASRDQHGRSKSFHPPAGAPPIPERAIATPDLDGDAASQISPGSARRYFSGLRRLASSSRSSIASGSYSRHSVSASSEMSSEDSLSIPTPTGLESASSTGSTIDSGHSATWTNHTVPWPAVSPKKSPGLGRAATFADKMFNRSRTKSTASAKSSKSAYDTIDRLTKSAATRSAVALIPPLDPVSFSLQVPGLPERDLPPLPDEPLISPPRRSTSLYVTSTSQFPPLYSMNPTSPVYVPPVPPLPIREITEPIGLDAMLSERLTSPVYTPHPSTASQGTQNLDALFSAKPTSPVYTPHHAAMKSHETITDSLASPKPESLLPSPKHPHDHRASWVSDFSMDSSTSSIPSPFFDSFPSVPDDTPLPPALTGRQRNFNSRPATQSFFDSAPLASSTMSTEFFGPSPSAYPRTRPATMSRISGDRR